MWRKEEGERERKKKGLRKEKDSESIKFIVWGLVGRSVRLYST